MEPSQDPVSIVHKEQEEEVASHAEIQVTGGDNAHTSTEPVQSRIAYGVSRLVYYSSDSMPCPLHQNILQNEDDVLNIQHLKSL